jgi:hypothetical protein
MKLFCKYERRYLKGLEFNISAMSFFGLFELLSKAIKVGITT